MKIIVLGAGQVGSSVAHHLANEPSNDVTVVDTRVKILRELQDRLDIRTVCGNAAHPSILERAGAADADMIVAVTSRDEINMVACQVAYTLYNTPTKLARVRDSEYLEHSDLFDRHAFPVDVTISPEQLVTNYIRRLIEYPGALQVLDFAGGKVQLVAVRAYYGGPLVGHMLRALREHMPGIESRVAAIFRRGRPIIPNGYTVIEADDEVFFIAARANIRPMISELRQRDRAYRRVMLAGGGNIGRRLAKALEEQVQIKIIERNPEVAKQLSEELDRAIVLLGDAADRDLLLEENIGDMDIFCAVTNDDQANILSAMMAKRMGVYRVMALINRPAYVDLVESGLIDIGISPQQVTIGTLLTHIRRGHVEAVHSLRRGAAEAIEAVAHGDPTSSKVVGRRIDEVKLPKNATIGALVRGDRVIMGHHDEVIQENDHVILFLADKGQIPEIEQLFQVAATFI